MVDLATPPLGLYVHMPWCVRKCPYCDFNSHALRGDLPARDYVSRLLEDLEQDLPLVWGRTVSSIYFGGGTPSLFSADLIDELIAGFRARLLVSPDVEISLEANPGTIEHDSFEAYRQAGINRVSLGAQSFDDDLLKGIGRIHGGDDVRRSLGSLVDAGMENFNTDLMFGLPGQTPELARTDLEQALAAGPAHISHYQLTLEPNTEFAVRPPQLPDTEKCWDMQEACEQLLVDNGYIHYEISAWSKPERQCRHNLNYWKYGDYLGIGAGAHAKLTSAGQGEIRRLVKQRHPKHYLAGERVVDDRLVCGEDRSFEFFLNVLRLRNGFSRELYEQRTGLAWETAEPAVSTALERGLLEADDEGFRPSKSGWRFANDLQAIFLP